MRFVRVYAYVHMHKRIYQGKTSYFVHGSRRVPLFYAMPSGTLRQVMVRGYHLGGDTF